MLESAGTAIAGLKAVAHELWDMRGMIFYGQGRMRYFHPGGRACRRWECSPLENRYASGRGARLRDDRQYAATGPYLAEVGLIIPSAATQASPAGQLLRLKPVCDCWHPMTEERRPANGHTKTGLPLRRRPAAASRWVEADGMIRQAEACAARSSNPVRVAVWVAVHRRTSSFQEDHRGALVQVGLS